MMSTDPGDIHPAMSEVSQEVSEMTAGPEQQSAWPTVVGIIGIIVASLTVLGAACMFGLKGGMEFLPEEQQEQLRAAISSELLIVSAIVSLILGLWLLFGSIRLMQRRGSSRSMLNSWAVLAIVWVVLSTAWTIYDSSKAPEGVTETAATDGATSESEAPVPVSVPPSISAVCGGIFSIIWPIIVLCFMNGQRQKQEMAGWSNNVSPEQFG